MRKVNQHAKAQKIGVFHGFNGKMKQLRGILFLEFFMFKFPSELNFAWKRN
jgi:hypothetical protein